MSIKKRRVGDIEIAHRWDGPAGAPVVMMAHAMGTGHKIWDRQVPALVDRYRLLRYDWRGHGDTDAPSTLRNSPSSAKKIQYQRLSARLKTPQEAHAFGVPI